VPVGHALAMTGRLTTAILPDQQRRTLGDLSDDLDLTAGDAHSKRSAFWTMLSLSGVIATAGVLGDSTATVIGAMIIAPLATPIMGIALGVAKLSTHTTRHAFKFVVLGSLLVIGTGVVFSFALPESYDLLGNSQISGRTSPGLVDLVAAVATGFAGAVALARRDVAAVLPGVAIAISLVPPLAVAGVCLGQGALGLAFGALVLCVSNMLALILAGSLLFTTLGYSRDAANVVSGSRRRAYLTISVLLVVVLVPLVTNTVGVYFVNIWGNRVHQAADAWLADTQGASVQGVEYHANTFEVSVQTPVDVPPIEDLVGSLDGQVPNGFSVVVSTSLGEDIEGGVIGG
jgi:uncharacterized hydrophobic protein (TIGR00271 family)